MIQQEEMLNLVGKQLEVHLCDKSSLTGRIYTIDPETQNLLICNDTGIILVPSSNISSYTVVNTNNVCDDSCKTDDISAILEKIDDTFFPELSNKISVEHSEKRKQRLVIYLEKHRVPIEYNIDTDHVVIAGVVTCRPPYDLDSCFSTNDTVLGRIQNLMKAFGEVS